MRAIRHIVIHCAATPNGKPFTIEDIDRWHRERGWRCVGYHFVIELDGTVRRGRDVAEIGAHVLGSNADSIGICMIGMDRFTPAQWAALAQLHADLSVTFPFALWQGHRDFSPDQDGDGVIESWEWERTCPGFDVRAWLADELKPEAAHVWGES